MRKILSTLLVAVMVLSLVGTAFAATTTPSVVAEPKFSDIAGNDAEADITLLAVKAIMKGDAGATTVRPDATITRVEFAAMVVRMLGKESLATSLNSMKPNTKDEIPTWGWGYVNVAQSMGIMIGDPDGKFRPTDNVTFAESLAMLERSIGQDKKATGIWPTSVLLVAYDLDLNDGVEVFANTPATRGEVAIMMVNTMNTRKYVGTDDDGLEVTKAAILETTTITGVVSAVSASNNTIDIGGTQDLAKSVSLIGAKTFADLLNQNVKAILNSDEEVVYIEITDDANVITGTFDEFTTNDDGEDVIVVDDKEYVLEYTEGTPNTVDATFHLNGTKLTNFTVADAKIVADDAVVLNVADDVIVNVSATRVTYTNRTVTDVTEVDDPDYTIDIMKSDGTTVADLEITTSTPLTIDGVKKDVTDLEDDDVVYVTTGFDAAGNPTTTVKSVEAFRATVKGVVTATRNASSGRTVTLKLADGTSKTYTLDAYVSMPTVGDTMEYRLNKAGKARFEVSSATTANIGYITDIYETSDDEYFVVLDMNGTSKTYEFDGTNAATLFTTDVNGLYIDGVGVDAFISFETNGVGLINVVDPVTFDVVDAKVVAIDAANHVVVLDNGAVLGVDGLNVYEENSDGTYTAAALSDLAKGDVVEYDASFLGLVVIPN